MAKVGEMVPCVDCGKIIQKKASNHRRCSACAAKADREHDMSRNLRKKPKKEKLKAVADELRLENDMSVCKKCAHVRRVAGFLYCNYLEDQEEYGLPARQWPRPASQECLFRSKEMNRAGYLTAKEIEELMVEGDRAVINTRTGKLYKGIKDAAAAEGMLQKDVKKQCQLNRKRSSTNYAEKMRFITTEEMALLKARLRYKWA